MKILVFRPPRFSAKQGQISILDSILQKNQPYRHIQMLFHTFKCLHFFILFSHIKLTFYGAGITI